MSLHTYQQRLPLRSGSRRSCDALRALHASITLTCRYMTGLQSRLCQRTRSGPVPLGPAAGATWPATTSACWALPVLQGSLACMTQRMTGVQLSMSDSSAARTLWKGFLPGAGMVCASYYSTYSTTLLMACVFLPMWDQHGPLLVSRRHDQCVQLRHQKCCQPSPGPLLGCIESTCSCCCLSTQAFCLLMLAYMHQTNSLR